MQKFSIISHITTSCNYNCSYCDVIKDGKKLKLEHRNEIVDFIVKNQNYIWDFKFFGWEPLLAFPDVKYIVSNSKNKIKNDFFELVTNTSLIKKEHLEYFSKNLKTLYFSVDNENIFRENLFLDIIKNYPALERKIYINLIIDPKKIKQSKQLFDRLYDIWFYWYNLLPIYFTKIWDKQELQELSVFIKYILDLSIKENKLRMYWFMNGKWWESKLSYNSLFINIDKKIYYSDMVSTFMWAKIKNELYIWETDKLKLEKLNNFELENKKEILRNLEQEVTNKVKWQKQLQKLMDYFSLYLNNK